MDKVNPADYLSGTLGAMAPNLDDPNCPYRNPFNPDKTLEFYECEMVQRPDDPAIPAKPEAVLNPGAIPSAQSLGISDPPPDYKQPVFNPKSTAIHPIFKAPDVPPMPEPRNSLTPDDPEKVLQALPDYTLHTIDSIPTLDDIPPFSGPQYTIGRPEHPQAKAFAWPKIVLSQERIEWLSFRDLDALHHISSVPPTEDVSKKLSEQNIVLKQALLEVLMNPSYAGWREDTRLHEALEQAFRSTAMGIAIDGKSALESEYFKAIFSRLNNGDDGTTKPLPDLDDPAWHVLQFLKTIEGYSQSDLYLRPEWLEQFQALLEADCDVPYTVGNSLLAAALKTVDGTSVISETLGVKDTDDVFHSLTDKVDEIKWSYEDSANPDNLKIYSANHSVTYVEDDEKYIEVPNPRLRYDETGQLQADGTYVLGNDRALHLVSDNLYFKAKRDGFTAINPEERFDYIDQKTPLFVLNRGEFAQVANAIRQYVCKNNVYYTVLGTTDGTSPQYILSDGSNVDASDYELFYRARIGEGDSLSYVYGARLYEWQEETEYILQSQCRANVHYEDYQRWSEESTGFTRTDDILYTKNALGEYTPISDVQKLYIATTVAGTSPNESTTNYLRIEFPGRFYLQDGDKYLYVPDPSLRYTSAGVLSATGTYVRTEEEGYFDPSKLTETQKKRFIQLYDSTYRKDGDTYVVAANGSYVYGQLTSYKYAEVDSGGKLKRYVKHEGNFSSSADDVYKLFSDVMVKGDDDHFYPYNEIYLRGLQSVSCPEEELLVSLENDETGPAFQMVVPSLPQQYTTLTTLAADKTALVTDLQAVETYFQRVKTNLATFTRQVDAFRNADEELEQLTHFYNTEPIDWSDAGHVEGVANQILQQLSGIRGRHGSIWRQYAEFIIETLKTYNPSEDSSIIFLDRCRQIDVALERVSKANGFTDEDGHALLTTHTDFFGKSLAEVFFQCQESARPETEEEFLRLFKLTQALTKEFNDLVVGWEAIDAKRYISQMLVTQRRQLQSAVNKLQALDWVNFRSLVAQKEFFEKATLLEHVFGNYGELSDDLIFSPAEVDMRIVQQSSLPNGSIYYRSVDGTFHPKDSIHAYVNTTYNIVTLSNFATVQRYDGNGRTNDEGLYIKINGQLALLDTYELNTHGGLTPITFFDGNNFAATSRFALNTTYTAYTSGSLDGYDYVVSGSTYYDRTQSGTFYLSTDGGVTKIPLQSLAFYQENPNATTYIRSDSGDYLRTDEGHYVERSEFSSFFEVAASSISTNGQLTRYRLTGDYYTADNSGEFVLIDGIFYRRNASNTVIQGAHYGSSEITRYSLENSYQSAINGPVICVSGEYRNIAGATFYFQPEGSSAFITVEAGANRYELNYTENASGTYVVETKDDGTEVGYLRNEVNLQVYAVQQGGNYVIIEHPEVSYQKSYFPKNSSGSSGEEDLYVADASGILYRHMSNNSFAEKSAVKWYFPNTSGTGYVEAPVDHDSQNSHILKEDTQVYEMEYVSDNTGGAYYKASDDNYYETDNVTAYYVDSDDGNKLFFVEHPEDISSDTVTIQKQYTVSYFLESDTTQSSPIDVSKRYKKNDDDDYKEDNDGTYIKTGTGTSDADFTLLSDLKAYYTNSSGTLTPISDTNFINGSETFTQDFTFNVTYCVRDTVTSGTSTSSSEDVVTVSDISQKYNYTQVLTETQPPADLWNNTDAYYVKIGNAYYLLSNLQEGSLSGNTLTGTADTTDYVHGYCQTTEVDDDFPDTSDVVEYKRGADSVFYVPTSLRRGFEKDSSIIIVETNADNTPKRYTQNHAVSDDGAYIKGNNGRFYTMVGNSFHYGTQEGPTVYLDQRFALSYRYIQSAMGNLIGVAGTENLLKIASEKRGARVGSTWEQITETTKFYERQGGFLEVGSTGAIPANAYIIDTEGLYHLARSCRFYANQEEISSFRPYRKTDTYSTTDNGSYLRKQDGTYFSRAHVLLGAALDYKGIQIEDADTRYNVSGGSGSPDPNGRYFRTVDGDFIEADTLKYYDGDSGAHIADTENQYFEISAGSQQYALFSTGATYLWFEGELDQLRLCTTNSTTGTYYYRYDTHTGQIQESPNGEHWIDIDFTEVAARWNAAAKYFKDAIRKERITDAFRYAEKSILTPLSAEEFQNVSPRHPIHQFLTSIQQYLATSLYQIGQNLTFFTTSDLDSVESVALLNDNLPQITFSRDSSVDPLQTLPKSILSVAELHYDQDLQDLYDATVTNPNAAITNLGDAGNRDAGGNVPISLANIVDFRVSPVRGTIAATPFSAVATSLATVLAAGAYAGTREAYLHPKIVSRFSSLGGSNWENIKNTWDLGHSDYTYRDSWFLAWSVDDITCSPKIRGYSDDTDKQARQRWDCMAETGDNAGQGMRYEVNELHSKLQSGSCTIDQIKNFGDTNADGGHFGDGDDGHWCDWSECNHGGKWHSKGGHFCTWASVGSRPYGSTARAIANNVIAKWHKAIGDIASTIIEERDTIAPTSATDTTSPGALRYKAWGDIKTDMEAFMGCFAHLGASDFLTEATTGYDALLTKLVADVTGLGADGINPDMGKSDFQALARRVNAVITNFKSQNGSTDTALGTKIKAFTNALAAYRLDTENVDILNTLSTAAGELKIAFTTAATGAALSSCTYFSNLNTIITNVNSVLNSIISVADASRKRLIRDMLEGKIGIALASYLDWRTNDASKQRAREMIENFSCGGITEVETIKTNVLSYFQEYQILDPTADLLPDLPRRIGFEMEGDILGSYRGLDPNSPYIAVDPIVSFSNPFRGTLSESEWQNVQVILNQLPCTGDSTFAQYLENIFRSIQNNSSTDAQAAHYESIATVLQSIRTKIDIYAKRNQATSDIYVTGFCLWYNHVVNLAHQQLRRQLQLYINQGRDISHYPFLDGWNLLCPAGQTTTTINNTALSENALRYLRHISFDTSNNQFSYTLPQDVVGTRQICNSFSGNQNSAISRILLKNITQAQINLQSEIDYYRKLDAAAQVRYNSDSIVKIIEKLRAYCQQISNISACPEDTKTLYNNQVASLDTLLQFFQMQSLQEELEKAYDILCKCELEYHDWRVNQSSKTQFISKLNTEKNNTTWSSEIRAHITEIHSYVTVWAFPELNSSNYTHSTIGTILKHRVGIFGDLTRDQYACIEAFNALTRLVQSYYPRDEDDLPSAPTPLMYQISGRPAPQPATLNSSLDLVRRYRDGGFQLLTYIRPFFDNQLYNKGTGSTPDLSAYKKTTEAMNKICGSNFDNYGQNGIGLALKTYTTNNLNFATVIGEVQNLLKQNPHWRYNSQELTRQLRALLTKRIVTSGGVVSIKDYAEALGMQNDDHSVGIAGLETVAVDYGDRTIVNEGVSISVNNMELYILSLYQDILDYKPYEDPYYVYHERDEELRQRIYDTLTAREGSEALPTKVQACLDAATSPLATTGTGINVRTYLEGDLVDIPAFETKLQNSFDANRDLLKDFSADEILMMQMRIRDKILLKKDAGDTFDSNTIPNIIREVYKQYAVSNLILGQNKGDLLIGSGILDHSKTRQLIRVLQNLVTEWNQRDRSSNAVAYQIIAQEKAEQRAAEANEGEPNVQDAPKKEEFNPQDSFYTGSVLDIIEQLKDVASNGVGYSMIQKIDRQTRIAENIFSSTTLPITKLEWHWTTAGDANVSDDALSKQGFYTFSCGGIPFIAAQIEDNIKIVATNAGSTITTTAMSSSDYPDVHGVFYRQNPDGSISTTALTFDKAGLTYFTRNGIFFVEDADGEETELRYDEQGYVTDSNGHIIFDETMQSYRYDRITGDILQVDTGSITQNLGKVKINATYTPFIKATREYGSPEAYYLSRPETAEHFFNELSNIAVSFENQYSEWKTSVSSFSQNDNDLVIAKSMVQFSNMLSQLRDRMMRHDVRRYQERNSFSQENYIITEIDDRIKTLFQEGIFEKFSHLSRLAFDFYEVAYNLTYAEGHGFRDQVDTLLPSYKEKKTLYENALQAVIGEHGNFTTLLSDLEELKNEAESELTYNTSQAETLSDKVRFVVTAAYAHKKYEVAQQLWRIVQSANYVKQCIDTYGLQTSTPTGTYDSQSLTSTKLYAELADMIRSGAHTSTFYLMDPASVCASTIRTQYHEYQGRTGDSTDVDFHREVLRMLQSGIYFHNGEELHLIANPSLQVYLQEQCDVLETYGKKLRTYEIYAGMKKDGFFAVASVGGREILTGGIGLERILKQHPKWFFSKAEQQILIADLQSLHEHIESSLALYAETGPLVGQLDTQTYKAIRTFQDYLGNPKNPEKRTLLESVMSFETFDLLKFRGAVDYKRQAWQLFALEKGFNSGEMSFEKYKTAIENPGIYGGPLDSYIDDMRNYVAYLKAIREYLEALLLLTPKHYYYDTNLAEWQEVPNDASEEKLLEIDDKGGQYVRLVSGYNSSGQPVFLEQEGSTPEKPIHIYASRSAVWHGSHNHLTWEYQLMAILYEKFTTQRWKIQDMLSEVEEYNNKLAEANQILAQINTVQAAATKAGEEAKGVIPVDIQFYFQEHKIQSPSSNFTSKEDMLYYQESPFGKRSDYLINECSAYPTGMLGYLIQDLIQDQGEGSTLPATLKAYDLLEMGSLYYIYHHQNEFSEATDINVDTVDSGDPYFGLGNLEHMKTFDSRSNVKERKLWEVYWNERKYYHEHPQEKLKSSVRKFVDNYTQGNIQSFKGDGISPFPSDSIGKNSTDHGMYRLKNTAPATNEWSGCGHYKYTAQRAAEAGGLLDTTYREDVNSKGFMEAMELVCHQKFYETSDANLTEPWYDWNAFLMIYKIEAMSDVYGYEVTDIAMQYLLGSKDANATRTALAALLDPNGTRKAAKKRVYSRNEMIDIMAYIDGEHLFSGTTDFADVPTERKEVLIYWWDHSHIGVQDGKIKGILDASMAAGATDLGADEVALWSENLRIHIDKLKSSQEVINTRMQRLLQRLNETTSLATQLLKVISESKKQSASNVR